MPKEQLRYGPAKDIKMTKRSSEGRLTLLLLILIDFEESIIPNGPT